MEGLKSPGAPAVAIAADVLKEDSCRALVDSNLTSAFLCSHAAYPAMKEGGCGKVINIGSMMSIFGAPFAAAYSGGLGQG